MKDINWSSTIKNAFVTAAAVMIGGLMFCMLLAWCISREWIPMEICKKTVPVLMSLCLFGGCCYDAVRSARQKLVVACMTAVITAVLLLIVKLLFFADQKLLFDWRWGLLILAGVGAGFAASVPRKRYR